MQRQQERLKSPDAPFFVELADMFNAFYTPIPTRALPREQAGDLSSKSPFGGCGLLFHLMAVAMLASIPAELCCHSNLAPCLFRAYSTTADDLQVSILCASLFGGSWKSYAWASCQVLTSQILKAF